MVCRSKRPADGTTSIHPCRYLLAEFGDRAEHDCSRNIAAVIPAASVATGTAEQAFTITPGLDRSVRVLNTPGGGGRRAGLGEKQSGAGEVLCDEIESIGRRGGRRKVVAMPTQDAEQVGEIGENTPIHVAPLFLQIRHSPSEGRLRLARSQPSRLRISAE